MASLLCPSSSLPSSRPFCYLLQRVGTTQPNLKVIVLPVLVSMHPTLACTPRAKCERSGGRGRFLVNDQPSSTAGWHSCPTLCRSERTAKETVVHEGRGWRRRLRLRLGKHFLTESNPSRNKFRKNSVQPAWGLLPFGFQRLAVPWVPHLRFSTH
jgi:hypothetical protein